MNLQDLIAKAATEGNQPIGDLLRLNGYEDLDAEVFQEALLHFSGSAPLPQAEALSPIVSSYYERSHNVGDIIDQFDEAEFSLTMPLPTAENYDVAEIVTDALSSPDAAFGQGADLDNSDPASSVEQETLEQIWNAEIETEDLTFEQQTDLPENVSEELLPVEETDEVLDFEIDLFE